MRKQVLLTLHVSDDMPNSRVVELIEQLHVVGLSDAADTVESDEGDCFGASEALTINLQSIEVLN